MQKTKISSQMPSSYDSEYFGDGDVRRINKSKLRDQVCQDCVWELLGDKREIKCKNCGRGFRFLTHQVEEFSDHIEVSTLNGVLKVSIE